MRKALFCLGYLILLIFSSCLKEKPSINQPYKGFTPVELNDGWSISNPSNENINFEQLDGIYRDVFANKKLWMVKSLLVFRNGSLIAESYLKDDSDRTKPDAIWSNTKQINSIITGIAINNGYIHNIHDSIEMYLPEYTSRFPNKSTITIEDLLTMRSGIAFDNGYMNDVLRNNKIENSLEYIFNMDLEDAPGTVFKYKDSDPHILSAIVQKATGKPMDVYGKEVLFDRLNISNYSWCRYKDGVTLGSWGISTTPRELAKIAQCVLDNGKYKGEQVIPSSWLTSMLSPHIPDAHHELAFGYLWWSYPSKNIFFTWGHGGQYAFIIPSKNMLVVITSLSQVDDDVNVPVEEIIKIAESIALTAD